MLFPLNSATQQCQAFIALNQLFLDFLEACIEAEEFSEDLFFENIGDKRPVNTGTTCWDNQKTQEKFEGLWQEIEKLSKDEREALFNDINSKQDVVAYFSDVSLDIPSITDSNLFKATCKLTKHLFEKTKDLAGIRACCGGETIQAYYNRYCVDNGKVCLVCGTELLAQWRANIADEKQWRSPLDHLLSKDKYPMYGVHPYNLMPICHTCNSKAKGAKELLLSGVARRLIFDPYSECCREYIEVKLLENQESVLELTVCFNSDDDDISEKLLAWDEVYQIKNRVEGTKSEFITLIDGECRPNNLEDFKQQLERHAQPLTKQVLQSEDWKFWYQKLFEWLEQQSDECKELLWFLIEEKRDDSGFADVFEI